MFTGIIERRGEVVSTSRRGTGWTLTIKAEGWSTPLHTGESVCVSGVCLSVTSFGNGFFACDVLDETTRRSTLGACRAGDRVNLERAVRAGDRFGGHFVTGHVDGTGVLQSVATTGDDHVLSVSCPSALMKYIVEKGSVACDGVSLTVAEIYGTGFTVHVIPITWRETTLGMSMAGRSINIETDLIAKHVVHAGGGTRSSLTFDKLRDAGFSV